MESIRSKKYTLPPRPSDFDLPRIQRMPAYAKWKALQDGETMVYGGRKFRKGSKIDKERFLRRMISYLRACDRKKAQRNSQNQNDSNVHDDSDDDNTEVEEEDEEDCGNEDLPRSYRPLKPRPSDFDLPRIQRTPTYTKWKALQDGETMVYGGSKFRKGSKIDKERLSRKIMSFIRSNDKNNKKRRSNQNHNNSNDDDDDDDKTEGEEEEEEERENEDIDEEESEIEESCIIQQSTNTRINQLRAETVKEMKKSIGRITKEYNDIEKQLRKKRNELEQLKLSYMNDPFTRDLYFDHIVANIEESDSHRQEEMEEDEIEERKYTLRDEFNIENQDSSYSSSSSLQEEEEEEEDSNDDEDEDDEEEVDEADNDSIKDSEKLVCRVKKLPIDGTGVDGFVKDRDGVAYPVMVVNSNASDKRIKIKWIGYRGQKIINKKDLLPVDNDSIRQWNRRADSANRKIEYEQEQKKEQEKRAKLKRKQERESQQAEKRRKLREQQKAKIRVDRKIEAQQRSKFGPRTRSSGLDAYTDISEGKVKFEVDRVVYFASDNDTPQTIAEMFKTSVERILYDNCIGKLKKLERNSRLIPCTPIVLSPQVRETF